MATRLSFRPATPIQADEPASWEAFKRRFGLIFMGALSDIGSAFPPEEDTPNNVSTVP